MHRGTFSAASYFGASIMRITLTHNTLRATHHISQMRRNQDFVTIIAISSIIPLRFGKFAR